MCYLTVQLRSVAETHANAREAVLLAIGTLASRLAAERVLIAEAQSPQDRWGIPSFLNVVIEELMPCLVEMLPIDRMTGWMHWGGEALFPMAEKLASPSHCVEAQQRLQQYCEAIDHHRDEHPEVDDEALHSLAESLHAVMEVLLHVQQAWPRPRVRWCKVCFRRAPDSSQYCDSHRPGQKENGTDTTYRKAVRNFGRLSASKLQSLFRHRACYLALSGSLRVLGSVAELVYAPAAYALTSPEVAIWLNRSLRDECWPAMAAVWEQFITREFPQVALSIGKQATEFSNWPSFASFVCQQLNNRLEKRLHPMVVLQMLSDAEAILATAQKNTDRRLTGTDDEILTLNNTGMKQADIARKVGVSRQYVSRVVTAQS